MKKIILSSLAFLAIACVSFLQSCKEKPCDVTLCANSGVCLEGACKCQVGYEGTLCETAMRDKFGGLWNVNEDGSLSSADQYLSSIETSASNLQVNEVYLYNIQNKFKAPVRGVIFKDSITIPRQWIGTDTIEGFGAIKGTNNLSQHYYQHATLTFYYVITNKLNEVNKYGYPLNTPNNGIPSVWSK